MGQTVTINKLQAKFTYQVDPLGGNQNKGFRQHKLIKSERWVS